MYRHQGQSALRKLAEKRIQAKLTKASPIGPLIDAGDI